MDDDATSGEDAKEAAQDAVRIQQSASAIPLMALNDTKAGMAGLDKDKINAIIEEASRGSKFYAAKQKAQERIDRQVEDMKKSLSRLTAAEVDRSVGKQCCCCCCCCCC